MRTPTCCSTVLAFLLTVTPALHAQDRDGVMGDLIHDVTTVETKVLGLANTMPPTVYDWRPAKRVRSTGEVLVHIAGDNYFRRRKPASMVETTKQLRRSRHAP
jgi:hypothetical protein